MTNLHSFCTTLKLVEASKLRFLRFFHAVSETHSSINATRTNQSFVIVRFLDLEFPIEFSISINARKNCLPLSQTTDAISGRLFEARRTYDLYVWFLYKDSPFVEASAVILLSDSSSSFFLPLSSSLLFLYVRTGNRKTEKASCTR